MKLKFVVYLKMVLLCMSISASIKNLPKCPQDVAEEALELARKKLVVKYE